MAVWVFFAVGVLLLFLASLKIGSEILWGFTLWQVASAIAGCALIVTGILEALGFTHVA
jgi:hypothetical protein